MTETKGTKIMERSHTEENPLIQIFSIKEMFGWSDNALVYAGIGAVFSYAVYKESQQLGCTGLTVDCDNANGKVVRGTTPSPTDTPEELVNKIDLGAEAPSRHVQWRKSFILGVVLTIAIWLCLYMAFPGGKELLVSTAVITFGMYFTSGFYKYHMEDYVSSNIKQSAKQLLSFVQ